MENIVREEISKTLNIDASSISKEDNLIAYGLHSLAIMQLVDSFSKISNKRLKYTEFITSPTIEGWTKIIQDKE
ncbi:acyl carrier protein [Brenneria sp. g21c3]|uniref:acyl carrier protein n=1 Tax=Brenneria sp. g21c3 TaxID=3093893 RepID=UPI002EAA8737|nr:acyl carrier protein [Brenneria sp. g21c3]